MNNNKVRKIGVIILAMFLLFVCADLLIAQADDYSGNYRGGHIEEPRCKKHGGCLKKIQWSSPETKEFTFVDGSTVGVNRVTDEVVYYGYRASVRFPGFRYPNKDRDFDKGSPRMGYVWMRVTDPQMKEQLKKLYLEEKASNEKDIYT